jgi:hypothetical protein
MYLLPVELMYSFVGKRTFRSRAPEQSSLAATNKDGRARQLSNEPLDLAAAMASRAASSSFPHLCIAKHILRGYVLLYLRERLVQGLRLMGRTLNP